LGFEYNLKENFPLYVEPSNLPNILSQNLKEEGSKKKETFPFYVEPSNLPNILLQNLKEEGSKKKENFPFYVEPSNLPNILLQNLKEEGSKKILVYGGFGYGKTTLVKYVLENAKELDTIFHGGIFHMRYGHKDNEVISCQKELIRALHLNPQEVSIQDSFACITTFYYHECGGRIVMNYLLGYVRHMCVCITDIYKCSSIIQTKLKKR